MSDYPEIPWADFTEPHQYGEKPAGLDIFLAESKRMEEVTKRRIEAALEFFEEVDEIRKVFLCDTDEEFNWQVANLVTTYKQMLDNLEI